MKILVIGGAGFIGKEIVRALTVRGNHVKSISRTIDKPNDIFSAGDFFNEEIFQLINDFLPDCVIQAAWITNLGTYRNSELNQIYAQRTIEIAEYCKNIGVSNFVGLGSVAEYETTNSEYQLSSYSISKQKTFQALLALSDTSNMNFLWARIYQPYGRGQDRHRLIPYLVDTLKRNAEVQLQNLKIELDWITSFDIGEAIAFAVENQISGPVDICTGIYTSNRELLELIVEILEIEPKIHHIDPKDKSNLPIQFSHERASQIGSFGWKPQFNLTSGLKWTMGLD